MVRVGGGDYWDCSGEVVVEIVVEIARSSGCCSKGRPVLQGTR